MIQAQSALISVFIKPELKIEGNTSMVIYTERLLSEDQMQKIAKDINQPATTFLSPEKEGYRVRWFAPDAEIQLCGHGTAAAILFLRQFGADQSPILFSNGQEIHGFSSEGGFGFSLDKIPVIEELPVDAILKEGLGIPIMKHYKTGNKNLVITDNEKHVREMKPDFQVLKRSKHFGFIVTAMSSSCDFASRTLVPHVKQLEDPATGSSHAVLATYWSEKLKKEEMVGIQLSERGGYFKCKANKTKIILEGESSTLFSGNLNIHD